MAGKRIILVTGANSGVGYAITQALSSSSPSNHIIMAARTQSKGEAALSEIKADSKTQGSLSFVQLDVDSESSITAAAKTVESEFGHLDVLINNAGIVASGDSTKKKWQSVIDTNVIGPVLVLEAFKPLLEKSTYKDSAYVLNITSGLGSIARSQDPKTEAGGMAWPIYSTSKTALNMITLLQAKELSRLDKPIKMFGVCPGLVVSNLRGTSEEQRQAGGNAGDPMKAGYFVKDVLDGKWDSHIGESLSTTHNAPYPW